MTSDDQLLIKKWWLLFSENFQMTEGFEPHPQDKDHVRVFEYFVKGAYAMKCNQNGH